MKKVEKKRKTNERQEQKHNKEYRDTEKKTVSLSRQLSKKEERKDKGENNSGCQLYV